MSDASPSPGPSACPECGGALPDPSSGCLSCAATRAPAAGAPSPAYAGPSEIAGFRIVREIGAGGMGTVFEAIDARMNRRVALKIMSRHHSTSEKAEVRFAREAWIGGKLGHPSLVKVYERGEWQELSYYSMELVDGGSLSDVMRRIKQWGRDPVFGLEAGTRDYVAWSIHRIVEAARGLDHAHRRGVIHRDVKPMNLLLARDPCSVKVADFGLALDTETTRLTTLGKVLGTVAYMAPEQIRGEAAAVGPHTDVYALGVTLFELLTFELPFEGATQQMYLNAVLTTEARRPSKLNEKVGRDLEVVLRKALEKSPRDRYRSAADLAEDLENVLGFKPINARPPTAAGRIARWARRKPVHAALALVLAVGLPVLATLLLQRAESRRALLQVERETLWQRAQELNRQQRYKETLDPLSRILETNPDDVLALRDRALCSYRLALAEASGPTRGELESKSLSDISRAVDLLAEASWPRRVRAFILARFNRSEEARRDLEEAARLRSSSVGQEEIQVDAILALESGENAEAARIYSDLMARVPGSVDVHVGRAEAYVKLGETERAVLDYKVAAALSPKDHTIHLRLGHLLTRAGDLEAGAAHARQALALEPGDALVRALIADNLLEQGRARTSAGQTEVALEAFREAEREARRGVELDPDLAWAHLDLGASLMEQNRLLPEPDGRLVEEATRHYGRAIDLAGGRADADSASALATGLTNQCDALLQVRDLDRALEACRRAAQASPDDPVGYYNLAGAYALAGRRDEALQALEKDVELGDRDHEYLTKDVWFASLRGDPRFSRLLRRMKETPRP